MLGKGGARGEAEGSDITADIQVPARVQGYH